MDPDVSPVLSAQPPELPIDRGLAASPAEPEGGVVELAIGRILVRVRACADK